MDRAFIYAKILKAVLILKKDHVMKIYWGVEE